MENELANFYVNLTQATVILGEETQLRKCVPD